MNNLENMKHKRALLITLKLFLIIGILFLIYLLISKLGIDNNYKEEYNFIEENNNQEQIISKYELDSWEDSINEQQNLKFKYPPVLLAKYISTVEWPPKITVSSDDFDCLETSPTSSFPYRILKQEIDDRLYCVEAQSEGAAGSVYTEYSYSVAQDERVIILNFILQYPRCDNYDEPKQSECKNERESFDLDRVINGIFLSIEEL